MNRLLRPKIGPKNILKAIKKKAVDSRRQENGKINRH
jgi:hypothetical protein